jgi:hypothetical protein
MPSQHERLSTEEVVARVEAWLKLPGSIEAILAAFEEADRFNKESAERARQPHPLLVPKDPNPRLRRGFFNPKVSKPARFSKLFQYNATMNAEPYILEIGTWWTVRLCANQSPIGQVIMTVNVRPDGSWAKDFTELNPQELLIAGLICKTLKRTLEHLYQPESFSWQWRREIDCRCYLHITPIYRDGTKQTLSLREIYSAIKEIMPLARTGRIPTPV